MRHNRDIISIFFTMKIYSNEYTQYTIFKIQKKISLNIPNLSYWIFSKGTKKRFETAVVKEPSVFEPLKVYCMSKLYSLILDGTLKYQRLR